MRRRPLPSSVPTPTCSCPQTLGTGEAEDPASHSGRDPSHRHPPHAEPCGSRGYVGTSPQVTLTPSGQRPCLISFMSPKHLGQCPKHNFFKVIPTVIRARSYAFSHRIFREVLRRGLNCHCHPILQKRKSWLRDLPINTSN